MATINSINGPTNSTSNAATYTSTSFTPTAGDTLVFIGVFSETTTTAPTMTDSLGESWTLIGTATYNGSANRLYCFIKDNIIGASPVAMTTTIDLGADAATGGRWAVNALRGHGGRTGSAAAKQFAKVDNQSSGGTPAVTFGSALDTNNATIGMVGNLSSPAGLTPPTGWSEFGDSGYATPTTGGEFVQRNSGSTATTVTWGSTSATAFAACMVELDVSAPGGGAQTLTQSATFSNSSAFHAPTVTPGAVTLSPSLYSNNNSFFTPTVSPGAVSLSPSLYSNTNSFNAHTLTATYSLTPGLYSNSNSFFAPTVTPGAVTLSPSLFSDGDTFFTHTLTPGAVTLTPGLYSNSNTFFGPTVTATYTLTPSLYSDGDTFHAPTVSASNTLTPGLYSDGDSFFAPTVTPGAVTLSPDLYSDGDTFFAPTVSQGAVTLSPSLYSNSNSFFSPTVTPGEVTLTPALYSDGDTFHGPTVTASYTLAPGLLSDGDTFFSPTVAQGAVTLQPSLYTNSNSFFGHVVNPGEVLLAPFLVSDGDTIYSPTVSASNTLEPGLLSDGDQFFSPSAQASNTLAPALFQNTGQFFSATVTNGFQLDAPLVQNSPSFFGHTATPSNAISAPFFQNSGQFFGHELILFSGDGSLTGVSIDRLAEIWARLGMDPVRPVTNYPNAIDFGPIHQTASPNGSTRTGGPIIAVKTADEMILEIWQRLGLDASNPLVQTPTTIQAGAVTMDVTTVPGGIKVTRQ